MKSVRFLTCMSFVSASVSLFCGVASAQNAADTLTDKGSPNVNQERPALPAVAANSPSGEFGDKGELTISSDAGLSISSSSVSGQSGSTTTITLRPAVDYFLANNFSLGGFVGVDHTSQSGFHSTTFAIGPRVGYNLAFSERWSFWPKLGFSYSNTSDSVDSNLSGGTVNGSLSTSNSHLTLNIFAPVMFHPVQHFFLGFGPALDTDLSGDAKVTTIAGRLTIGGWL